MVSHGLLFWPIVNPKLFDAPAVIDFVADSDFPCYPFHGQPHEEPSGVDHELRKAPRWEYLGFAMVWSHHVSHVEPADAEVAGDDITTLRTP